MINCLKSDFYRIIKSKFVYILLAVLIVYSAFMILVFSLVEGSATILSMLYNVNNTGKDFFFLGMLGELPVYLIAAIFVSIFIGTDFSSGMMKNYVSTNTSRTKIFFSKLIVCMIVGAVFLLASSLVDGLIGTIVLGYGQFAGIFVAEYLVKFLLVILLLTAYTSIFLFMCFLMRSPGVIPINILIVELVGGLLMIFAMVSDSLAKVGNYWLVANIDAAATSIYPAGLIENLLRIILVGVSYTVLFLPSAYMLFRFRDVK